MAQLLLLSLEVQEAIVFLWTGPVGFTFTDSGLQNQSDLVAGNYNLTVTDANGCTVIDNISLGQAVAISATATVTSNFNGEDISCFGLANGVATVNASGGTPVYAYLWDGPLSHTFVNSASQWQSNLHSGDYFVTVTDLNGCSVVVSQTISEPVELTSSLIIQSDYNGEDISCYGNSDGSVDLSYAGGTAPMGFLWSGPVGYIFLNNTAEDQTELIAGAYNVTVTDLNGCSSLSTITLTQPDQIAPVITASNSHCTQNDGSASVAVTGGNSPYTYLWSSGGSANIENNLFAGIYALSITDVNSCLVTVNANISDQDGGNINILSVGHNTCHGESIGNISVEMTGGVAPFAYSWNTGSTDSTLTSLVAGVYSLEVTDNTGCVAASDITTLEPSQLFLANAPSTQALSYHGPIKQYNMGVGGCFYNDRFEAISRTGAHISYAYLMQLQKLDSKLAFGVSTSIYQFQVDENRLHSLEEDDAAIKGGVESKIVPDANFGLYLYNGKYFVGFAATQLFQSKLTIGSEENSSVRHYFLTGGYRFSVSEDIDLEPSALFKATERSPAQLDLNLKTYFKKDYWVGLSYRTGGMLVTMIGLKYDRYYLAYAFDYTFSSIQKYSNGTHEIMIGINFGK